MEVIQINKLLLIISNFNTERTHDDWQPYPSISLLSDAGISLSIQTDSPDLSDLEQMPGLLDISMPDNHTAPDIDINEQQTKRIKPHTSTTVT